MDGPALLADLATLDSLADRQLAASTADERHIADLLVDQIEFANLLLLNKCDRLAPVRLPSLGPSYQLKVELAAKHFDRDTAAGLIFVSSRVPVPDGTACAGGRRPRRSAAEAAESAGGHPADLLLRGGPGGGAAHAQVRQLAASSAALCHDTLDY